MWYDESDLFLVKKALSLKLPEFLQNIPHADIIEEKALDLLNIPSAVTLSLQLSLLPMKKKSIFLLERLILKTTKLTCLRPQLLNAAVKVLDFQIFAAILLLCLKKRVFWRNILKSLTVPGLDHH